MTTHVEFTSYVDRGGYKIVPAKRPQRKPGQSKADWLLDSPVADEARIVSCGGGRLRKQLGGWPMLYIDFANVETPEQLLEFVTHYGPLTAKNEIGKLLDTAAEMRELMQGKTALLTWPIADLKASIVKDKGKGTVGVKFQPARLLDALWLQFAQAQSGGAQFRKCEHCAKPFLVGGNSRKRLVAKFCCDQHRIEFNSHKRSQRST